MISCFSDSVEQCFSSLSAHFRSFDINVFHELVETVATNHVAHMDHSGDCKTLASFPIDHVQLWPLSDYLGTLTEWKFITSVLMSELGTEDCATLIDYFTYYSPVTPSDLYLIKNFTEENRKVRISFLKSFKNQTVNDVYSVH